MNPATQQAARSAWAIMSEQAARSRSEGENGIALCVLSDPILQARPVRHIDPNREQVIDEVTQPDIAADSADDGRVDLDRDVEITVGPRIAPGDRTKQSRVKLPAAGQPRLVGAQDVEGGELVHGGKTRGNRRPAA
ncbi:hypothetical protein JOE48_002349 [Methylobacterium sp. PvR107]|nr:hypothetical protein [Methylobacterium sp. PvR107]